MRLDSHPLSSRLRCTRHDEVGSRGPAVDGLIVYRTVTLSPPKRVVSPLAISTASHSTVTVTARDPLSCFHIPIHAKTAFSVLSRSCCICSAIGRLTFTHNSGPTAYAPTATPSGTASQNLRTFANSRWVSPTIGPQVLEVPENESRCVSRRSAIFGASSCLIRFFAVSTRVARSSSRSRIAMTVSEFALEECRTGSRASLIWFLTQMYARFRPRQVGHRSGKTLRMCPCRYAAVQSSVVPVRPPARAPLLVGGPARRQPDQTQAADAMALTWRRTEKASGRGLDFRRRSTLEPNPSLTVQPPWNWQPRHDSAGWCGRIFREPATPPQIQTVLVGHVSH